MMEEVFTGRLLHRHLVIWILVPTVDNRDANIAYYCDFEQSYQEYRKVFHQLDLPWVWLEVSMENLAGAISGIIPRSEGKTPVVLNLCDGDEQNGVPGLSVIRLLQAEGLMYTGADAYFYDVTTSKITMKKLFGLHGVPTPEWQVVSCPVQHDIFTQLPGPLFIKPAVSAGSMGIDIRSVVYDRPALQERISFLQEGYRGWKLAEAGIIAEQFINGPEYTSLIVGDWRLPAQCFIYPPVENFFHPALPDREKFLSFDRLWEMYDYEKPLAGNEDFYSYRTPDPQHIDEINRVSLMAYIAVKGTGYGRIDMRRDKLTGKLYVLEVNAQCGLSEDENYTAVGAILRLAGQSFAGMITRVLDDAISRNNRPAVQEPARMPAKPSKLPS